MERLVELLLQKEELLSDDLEAILGKKRTVEEAASTVVIAPDNPHPQKAGSNP